MPNGIETLPGYDSAHRLTTLTERMVTETQAIYTYTLNELGNRTAATETLRAAFTSDLIFADGFERGNLLAWSSAITDSGDLSVTAAAALVDTYGLSATIDGTGAIYVLDDTPNAAAHYRARFYFNPTGVGMADTDAHYIFYGYRCPALCGTVILRLELMPKTVGYAGYFLRASTLDDSSVWANTDWVVLTTNHLIELDWQAATSSGADDGALTLWVDGSAVEVTKLDNDTRSLDQVRLGAVSGIDAGTSGTYTFDAFESRTSTYIGPVFTTTAISYAYDALSRLTTARYTPTLGTGSVFTYTYDAVGNRLTQQTLTATTYYTYDTANRLTNVNSGSVITYQWDNNGNLLNDGAATYAYDAANRLITTTSSVTYTYAYNGTGDRLVQRFNGVPTTYTLDLAGGLSQVLADGTYTYTYALGRVAQKSPTSTVYFLSDALGSVRQLANESGSVVLLRRYDPYGNGLVSTGSASSSYGFTGEWTDSYINLLYLRARYYSFNTGRFISRDTYGGDYSSPQTLNRWNYVML